MSGWNNKEIVYQFIELYRSLPALWKIKSQEYSNKLTRELAYSKMIEFCRKFDSSADKQFVVKKINNLRSSFRKELKKVETGKVSGAGSDELYESRLWYYPYLMFIKDQEISRTGMSNLDIENAPSQGSSDFLTEESQALMSPSASDDLSTGLDCPQNIQDEDFNPPDTLSQSPFFSSESSQTSQSNSSSQVAPLVPAPDVSQSQGPFPVHLIPGPSHSSFNATQQFSGRPAAKMPAAKRPKKRNSEDEEILNAARARLLTPPPTLDENESFGKTIALLLRNTSNEQRIYARKVMYEVMAEAELGNLSKESYFVASPSGARRFENVPVYQSYHQAQ